MPLDACSLIFPDLNGKEEGEEVADAEATAARADGGGLSGLWRGAQPLDELEERRLEARLNGSGSVVVGEW